MNNVVNQPDAVPTRKVTAGGAVSATMTLIIWVVNRFLGLEEPISAEEAGMIITAASTITAYFVSERRTG